MAPDSRNGERVIFLPNVIKIDPYELYRFDFEVGAFLRDSAVSVYLVNEDFHGSHSSLTTTVNKKAVL